MTTTDTEARSACIAELTAYRLANEADCHGPDSDSSPGAMFLLHVRDAVAEMVDDLDPEDDPREQQDRITEIADGAPDVYTYARWLEFVDLCAWDEDPTDLGDGGDMTQNAGVCLYRIAERLAYALVGMVAEADEDRDDEDNEA